MEVKDLYPMYARECSEDMTALQLLCGYSDRIACNDVRPDDTDCFSKFLKVLPQRDRELASLAVSMFLRQEQSKNQRMVIHSSADLYSYFYPLVCGLAVEEFWVLFINQASRVIASKKIGMGGIIGVTADTRIILREAVLHDATSIAVCHNHPSGNIRPSCEDNHLTHTLAAAAKAVGIRLIDHIIIGGCCYYSYNDEGTL